MPKPLDFNGGKSQSLGNKKVLADRRLPTLSECLPLAAENHYFATVLQKICHYCIRPRFEIDGRMYSAPTTASLSRELGMSEATINKAFKFLKETGVIETKVRRFNRSPRRYVRLLKSPADVAVTRSPSECVGVGIVSATTGASSPAGTCAPSPSDTVQVKKKKKKENENDEYHPQQNMIVPENEAGSPNVASVLPFSGEIQPKRAAAPLWTPKNIFEQVEINKVKDQAKLRANQLAYQLYLRRGWDDATFRRWQHNFFERCVREYRRRRAEEGPPK